MLFFNEPPTTEIYTLSLHDALPIWFGLIAEAMAGAFGGERTQFLTVVFAGCSMIAACELAADYERALQWCHIADGFIQDRKSTRLNSSHVKISYAVFCLKKKKQEKV